ncbi:MAG: hypothetical protein UR62_C0017G0010 [Candidatus Nomurabacteria bacterium GW2011_GWF2_35_12]|uniref:Nucleotidyltransferase n=3 Tax=Candidatus Nomuraibacteriota TaxID=1752729 RepID=A0A0G0DUE1_9BACT|nr:MAG: hypothetical protein UR62_C0017G0010 [Candidatus Nomurabacteria bacterium GW2011_GWF2_35_12]KKP71885.1 MAG: hypothetical protein UR70_C0017G0003 [Candidatus Nomurabacteria bacterium GW2011_GWB1_35_20]KKP75079.1 MAG: hypothetical protein UR72_C0007G0013 [Parcubacteria group bacterium GW2011_GWC1_35_21]KKP77691.1 MAG: hypothetical protein UR77_C0017G0018 [Candidatus Nomurabacteria bacterium GW2011_GWC2_35_35]KKP87959.1 MAG: hypothetical protein UR92_C0017G0009 [Candidatus Nomurabacteria b
MKEDSVYLNHILEAINNIFEDTNGFIEEQFLANRTIKQAVTRNIEVIGEAVKLVSENIRNKNPDVPWQKIARTRDMLIHHYFDVDDKELWKIIVDDLPMLKKSIQKILSK